MKAVEVNRLGAGRHHVGGEVAGERRRSLLGTTAVDAQVGLPQIERAQRAHRALADGGGIGRVLQPVLSK